MGIFQRRRGIFAAASDWQLWIFKNWKFHHFPKWISGIVWAKKTKTKQNKNKITSSNAHKVLNRQKNFRTLTENLFVKIKKCSNIGQETLNHGNKFESTARQIYIDVMKFKLKHNFLVRETSVVIQPLLYWLAASPDGLQMKVTLPYLDYLKFNALFPNIIYTQKICLKIRVFMSNYEMECHT